MCHVSGATDKALDIGAQLHRRPIDEEFEEADNDECRVDCGPAVAEASGQPTGQDGQPTGQDGQPPDLIVSVTQMYGYECTSYGRVA